jgi:hypothetical protein
MMVQVTIWSNNKPLNSETSMACGFAARQSLKEASKRLIIQFSIVTYFNLFPAYNFLVYGITIEKNTINDNYSKLEIIITPFLYKL